MYASGLMLTKTGTIPISVLIYVSGLRETGHGLARNGDLTFRMLLDIAASSLRVLMLRRGKHTKFISRDSSQCFCIASGSETPQE